MYKELESKDVKFKRNVKDAKPLADRLLTLIRSVKEINKQIVYQKKRKHKHLTKINML